MLSPASGVLLIPRMAAPLTSRTPPSLARAPR